MALLIAPMHHLLQLHSLFHTTMHATYVCVVVVLREAVEGPAEHVVVVCRQEHLRELRARGGAWIRGWA